MPGVLQVDAVLDAIGDRLLFILPTVVTLAAVVLLQHILSQGSLADIPIVGQELDSDEKRRQVYLAKARDLYLEGYKKVSSGGHRPSVYSRLLG